MVYCMKTFHKSNGIYLVEFDIYVHFLNTNLYYCKGGKFG